jgi:hypothetical protein
MVEDESLVDIDMLQTGHMYTSLEPTIRYVIDAVCTRPRYPVLIGEVCYEGEYGSHWQDMQRFYFWGSMTNGAAGHTYGANGIWQFITEEHRFVGIRTYGDSTWDEAMHLPGSRQVGIGRKLLMRLPWWRLEPVLEKRRHDADRITPFRSRIPGKLEVIYLPGEALGRRLWGLIGRSIVIEPGTRYRARFVDPRDGSEREVGPVHPDQKGRWEIPEKPTREDLLLILEGGR